MENKKILITGGAGFIGNSLVRYLLKHNKSVRVLDNFQRSNQFRLKDIIKNIDFIEGDIRDESILEKACHKIDTVIHLAYLNGTKFFYTKPELVFPI